MLFRSWEAVSTGAQADDAATAGTAAALTYPVTRTVDVIDEQFGIKVADPYR